MNIGEYIYHHRIQQKMTQEELADGICTTSYLSKIENSKTEASKETIALLLKKLGVRWKKESGANKQECNQLLHKWYRMIKRRNKQRSKELLDQIIPKIEHINDPHIINTFQLFRLRYCLLLGDFETSQLLINSLEKQHKLFSLEQEYYWNQFRGLYESMNQQFELALKYYSMAEKIMFQLNLNDADIFYQFSYVYSRTFQVANTIVYATQALEGFYRETNLLKCIHCHIILGINLTRIKEFNKALEHFETGGS